LITILFLPQFQFFILKCVALKIHFNTLIWCSNISFSSHNLKKFDISVASFSYRRMRTGSGEQSWQYFAIMQEVMKMEKNILEQESGAACQQKRPPLTSGKDAVPLTVTNNTAGLLSLATNTVPHNSASAMSGVVQNHGSAANFQNNLSASGVAHNFGPSSVQSVGMAVSNNSQNAELLSNMQGGGRLASLLNTGLSNVNNAGLSNVQSYGATLGAQHSTEHSRTVGSNLNAGSALQNVVQLELSRIVGSNTSLALQNGVQFPSVVLDEEEREGGDSDNVNSRKRRSDMNGATVRTARNSMEQASSFIIVKFIFVTAGKRI
jgi:hypothetical protein